MERWPLFGAFFFQTPFFYSGMYMPRRQARGGSSSALAAEICPVQRRAKAFFDTLDISDAYMSSEVDRCYCDNCYKNDWPNTISNDGPTAYIIPRGWVRFGLAMPPRVKALDVFNKWSTSFHGVSSANVLQSVLDSGQLMKAGDALLDGTKLKSSKCAGRQDKVFYTSPTVRYAGLKFYAEPTQFGTEQLAASIALQCRQQPRSYEAQGETMRFSEWPGHLERTCPHTDLKTVEWKSERNVGAIPYGILVRVWPYGRDPEETEYSSPIDAGCSWHIQEQKAKVAPTRMRVRSADACMFHKPGRRPAQPTPNDRVCIARADSCMPARALQV